MSRAAAIFDLDRTLLAGASGPVISRSLRAMGLLPESQLPGEDFLFGLFNRFGENRPSMILTRHGARLAGGWRREVAQQAGKLAGEVLADNVQPYARVVIDEHHQAGRVVAIATTTPYDMVKPFAELLGIDQVIATRYGEDAGHYDGSIVGPFVWGKGKLEAVRTWAAEHDISLADSYAYSDSYYDAALLGAVGHPVVVNPDPRMRFIALARRWPTVFFDVPPGVPKLAGVEPQQALLPFLRPELVPYARFDIEGTEHLPARGAAIICGNHRSYFDPMALGMTIARRGRPVRFLGKREVFDAPLVGDLARAMGGIRVDRGTGSDEPLREAAAALAAGELVAVMPQGTIPRGRAFFDPVLRGRWGAARLAELSGAPVIPVGLWGTERVWPRSARVPNVWNVTSPPTVRVRVGEPVDLVGEPGADTERIMSAVVELLPAEAREWREPTAEELARTLPPGASSDAVDADHENERRPGSD
ncbi:MAG: HAD-IB family hydrolase [Acidimicrobiales bacterium]|jgi:putative phosphoserine phosphatase/1-acylglycerol-3-phosphate O-acyltransferase|nr:HAD-IB family hydrolase [Acidimicrobiales bacterium]